MAMHDWLLDSELRRRTHAVLASIGRESPHLKEGVACREHKNDSLWRSLRDCYKGFVIIEVLHESQLSSRSSLVVSHSRRYGVLVWAKTFAATSMDCKLLTSCTVLMTCRQAVRLTSYTEGGTKRQSIGFSPDRCLRAAADVSKMYKTIASLRIEADCLLPHHVLTAVCPVEQPMLKIMSLMRAAW